MAPAANRVIAYWPLLAFVAFAWTLFPPVVTAGYNWLGELALSVFLLVSLALLAFGKAIGSVRTISRTELIWIVWPMTLLTLWSGLSCFWATSWRNALHHTLLWGCFTIFYILIRLVIDDRKWLAVSLNVTRYVVFVLGSICVIEFLLSTKQTQGNFLTRYYPYTEIFITLLPIILVLVIDTGFSAMRWISFSLITWFAVVVVASRTVFAAGVGAILAFTGVSLAVQKPSVNTRRWLTFLGLAVAVTIGSQMILKADAERALFQRFTGADKINVQNAGLRFFYWQMAVEGFKLSPIVGIGGDNYFTEYKVLRERYTAANHENQLLELSEELLPERAHNEYLQIVCELGTVGGLIFAGLLAGLAYMGILAIKERASLLTCGALVGIAAFLAASFATSYSFRIPINGLCFFFLTAVAARELFASDPDNKQNGEVGGLMSKPIFLIVGLVVCTAMLGFSVVRGLGLSYLSHFQSTQNRAYGVAEIQKAIALDPSEPMFRFSYGQELFFAGRNDPRNYDEAVSNFRHAVDHGLATSPVYFNLLGAQMRARKLDEAEATFQEALSGYPRSVFLRTAYVTFLRLKGDLASADVEYAKALEVDPVQARSWQLAHDEGLQTLAGIAKTDSRFLDPSKLVPVNGPTALYVYQRQP